MSWVELTEYEQETFNCGVEFGAVSPEDFVADGDGPYLMIVLPAIRLEAGDDLEEFELLLNLFWAGWSTTDHTWDEEDYAL